MLKKLLIGLLIFSAVMCFGMKFTEFSTIKLATAPGTGVNPPSGCIFQWETVSGTTLTINYRLSSGIDYTFTPGSTYTLQTASASVLGGIKIGTGLSIDGNGVVTVSGGSLPVTALGTSDTQTIDRAVSDKFTITPSAAVTLATANFTDMQEAEIEIINGNNLVSFPADWRWQTAVPILGANYNSQDAINLIKIQKISTYYYAYSIASFVFAYPSSTVLMLHFNNNLTDNSLNGYVAANTGVTFTNSPGEFKWGYAAVFNGSSSLSYPDLTRFKSTTNVNSIEFWFKSTQTTTNATMVSAAWSGSGFDIQLNYPSAGNIAVYESSYSSGAALLSTSGLSLNNGVWHHLCYVNNGSTHYLFIDGTQRSTITATFTQAPSSSNPLLIGMAGSYGPRYYTGSIDELRIYKNIAVHTSSFTAPTLPN